MKVFSRLAVVSAVMVGLAAFAAPVHAGDTRTPAPLWRRELPALTADLRFKPVLRPLAGGTLLVRNGAGVAALDARGRTLWSEPDIDGFIADGAMVVFRRSGVVFAMRRRDAGVLWRRPCSKPNYLVAAGDRVLTICGGRSTVLGARTGSRNRRSGRLAR
jgi:outer membrane protein assembly factor BamB